MKKEIKYGEYKINEFVGRVDKIIEIVLIFIDKNNNINGYLTIQ